LSVWLSVDPLNILYPNQSPYCYGGNNPIFYIDPDGMTIYPHGSPEFRKKFEEDLEMLKKTEQGRAIIAYLETPGRIVHVYESNWNKSNFNQNGNIVHYENNNFINYDYDGVEYVSFIALGHELKHAYDKYTIKDYWNKSSEYKEISAVKFENYLRSVYKSYLEDRGVPFAIRYNYTFRNDNNDLISWFNLGDEIFPQNYTEENFNRALERINAVPVFYSGTTYSGDNSIHFFHFMEFQYNQTFEKEARKPMYSPN